MNPIYEGFDATSARLLGLRPAYLLYVPEFGPFFTYWEACNVSETAKGAPTLEVQAHRRILAAPA